MRAVRLTDWGREPTLTEVERPVPRDAEVLVRVEAAGLCHSDVHVVDAAPGVLPYRPPFTLGHEIAGHVAALGPDAHRPRRRANASRVYGPWGCGACARCAHGRDNYCDRRGDLGLARRRPRPGRRDGRVRTRPVTAAIWCRSATWRPGQAAPLTDAGLTSYHAVAGLRHALGEGTAAVVVGVGGLGHLAVQILRADHPEPGPRGRHPRGRRWPSRTGPARTSAPCCGTTPPGC